MAMNIFLWATILWIAPLLYYQLKNETKFKKNIIIGVTLPYEAREDAQVQQILADFHKQLKQTMIVLILLGIACIPIRDFGLMMTLYLLWIDAVIFANNILYILCNKKLRELKLRRGWKKESANTVSDLPSDRQPTKLFSPLWFSLPLLVSLLPFLWDRTYWAIYVTDAALILFSWFCCRITIRRCLERVDDDPELTETLTLIRRRSLAKSWLVTAWFAALINLAVPLTTDHVLLGLMMILLFAAVLTIVVVRAEFHVRKMQEELTRGSGKDDYADEDDHWIFGMFYYNPEDRRLMVSERTGMNMSFNLAKTSGRAIMLSCLLLLLAMPFFGIWILYEERQPVRLTCTDEALTASHTGTSYEIGLDNIETAELLTKLPQMSKIAGSGLDSVLKGKFSVKEIGRVTACLDPRTGPWLLVTTDDGRQYLLGSSTEVETEKLWELLSSKKASALCTEAFWHITVRLPSLPPARAPFFCKVLPSTKVRYNS